MQSARRGAFAGLLKRYRLRAGLTQERLAERAGLSVRAIMYLEQGARSPYPDTLGRLAAALALTPPEWAALTACAAGGTPAPPLALGAGSDPPHALVGRTREQALLRRHLDATDPPLLVFAGEPGIGKTRLLQEAAHLATATWTVLACGAQQPGLHEPYAPVLQAVQEQITLLGHQQRHRALEGCAWLARLLPDLVVADARAPLPSWTLSPAQERRLIVQALLRFLRNIAGPAGTLLLLDDLQWAAPDALDLLATLMRAAGAPPIRAVAAYRDSEAGADTSLGALLASLVRDGLVMRCRLSPLSVEEAAALLDQLIGAGLPHGGQAGHADGGREVRDRVLQRAEGVPFFLVSWAHAVQSGPALGREPGGGIPWDVAQSVRLRVAALPGPTREVLHAAAIIGRHVSPRLLGEVVGGADVAALPPALAALCRAHLLVEEGQAYRFAHDLIREVIAADLGAARRSQLHHRVATVLAQGRGAASAPEVIAYHYAQTEEHETAAYWLEQAGDHAAALCSTATAIEHYAAACANHRATGGADSHLARLSEKLGDLRYMAGDYARAQEEIARARARETRPARRAVLHRKEGDTLEKRGHYAAALAAYAAADAEGAAATERLPAPVRAEIALSRAQVFFRQGAIGALEEAAAQAMVLLEQEDAQPGREHAHALAHALYYRATAAHQRGAFAQAAVDARRSLALMERVRDRQGVAAALLRLGESAFFAGDTGAAEEFFRQSLATAEESGDRHGMARAYIGRGLVAGRRGALAEAEQEVVRSQVIAEEIGDQETAAWCRIWRGDGAYERHDYARAREWYAAAHALVERIGQQSSVVGMWRRLGMVALAAGDLDEAAHCFRRLLQGLQPDEAAALATCHVYLALVAHAGGDHDRGEVEVRQALRQAAGQDDQQGLAWCWTWATLGVLACRAGDYHAAAVAYRAAQGIVDNLDAGGLREIAALGRLCARRDVRFPRAADRAGRALRELGHRMMGRPHGSAVVAHTLLLAAALDLGQGTGRQAGSLLDEMLPLVPPDGWEALAARRLAAEGAGAAAPQQPRTRRPRPI